MTFDAIISYVNLAGMLIAPIGFFFWVKFKVGQNSDAINEIRLSHKEEIIQIKASKHAMKEDLESRLKEYKQDQKEVNEGLRSEVVSLRTDISSLKTELLTAINNIKK